MITRITATPVLLFLAAIAHGQLNQASISGVVTDAQGAAVPGAAVVATNTATDARTRTSTNEAGFYSIPNLPIGAYSLTVERQGFRRYEHKDITLNTGRVLEISVRLELGAVTETISVTGEAALVETRTSDVTQLIESKSIEELPLGNRRKIGRAHV